MTCPRCAGSMMPLDLHDHEGTYLTLPGWRCIACGEVLDPTILANRRRRTVMRSPAARPHLQEVRTS